MATTYDKLLLEINQTPNDLITAVQNDTNSRYLDVNLYDNGAPINLTGNTVRMNVTKPDGTTSFTQGEITEASNGRCQFLLTTQILAVTGYIDVQISIWSGSEKVLSSNPFKIFILPTLRNDEEVESTNEYGALVVLFSEIQNALDLMHEMVNTFGVPGAMAEGYGVETFWGMLEHLAAGADVNEAIKTNVNSTMDTSSFEPLNQIVTGGNANILNSISSVQSFLNTLKNSVEGGGVPIIRHIQIGTASINNDSEAPVTLSGFTNPAKMMVNFNGIYAEGGYNGAVKAYTPYIASISTTQVTFKFPESTPGTYISYQVIEFY